MPRIGPVSVTQTVFNPRSLAGAFGGKFTVTLPSNPTGPWTAKGVLSDGVEMPCTTASLNTGTRALTVTFDNLGMYRAATLVSIAVDY